jgi:hypothetical protein
MLVLKTEYGYDILIPSKINGAFGKTTNIN